VAENRLPFVRNTTFAEDVGRIRTGRGPENMATLRSVAVSTLRRSGHQNSASALGHVSYQPFTRPLELLGIT
jgi:hypothetical protein